MQSRSVVCLMLLAMAMVVASSALARDEPSEDGVKVGRASALRNLVPAEGLEKQATLQYTQLMQAMGAKQALAPDNHPELLRLREIARRIIPQATRFNPRAAQWQWEVNLIGSNQINAFCMPGGKIAFYTGILRQLQLTDDEVAMVMGHEIAHALREHARDQAGKNALTKLGAIGLSVATGGKYDGLVHQGANLLTLQFSRSDETDADLVGLDIAARAGYDPRAGVTLWQKMSAASKGTPPSWLSTHPTGPSRIKEIEAHLKEAMPLYERAEKPKPRVAPVARTTPP